MASDLQLRVASRQEDQQAALPRIASNPSQPALASRVIENAQARRQAALNRIEVLRVELANQQALVGRCDEFLALYSEFAEASSER